MSESQNGNVVAIAGATGAVGEVLLRVLEQREFPVSELRPLASERSAGKTIRFRGEDLAVRTACAEEFDGCDFVFFAATGALSKELAPEAARRGAIAIDKSGTWRMDPEVPLVVPEVNGAAVEDHHGIIACPNCTTVPLVMVLEAIRRSVELRHVIVTTLQAVSGAGLPGIDELDEQLAATQRGEAVASPKTFAAQIAHNAVPLCESFCDDGYSTEEHKLRAETRKILGLPDLDLSMTCIRVPVRVGHSGSVLIETDRPLDPADARDLLAGFPGIEVLDDPASSLFPTPLDAEGRDEVLVGRVRKDLTSDRLWLWEVCDNLRKGAATNAVQIAEEVLRRGVR